MKVEFQIVTQNGFSGGLCPHKSRPEFHFVSRCNRWHARQGNFGTMILTDRKTGQVHVVKGKMPEVVAEATRLQNANS